MPSPLLPGQHMTWSLWTCGRPRWRRHRDIPGSFTAQTHDIDVVALAAHVVAGAKEKFQAAGMNGFVEKPIDTELLFKTIEEHTGTPLTRPDFV